MNVLSKQALFLLCLLSFATFHLAHSSAGGKIVLQLTGIPAKDSGQVRFFLFKSQGSWSKDDAPEVGHLEARELSKGLVIDHLESNEYAVTAYLDANRNGIHDRNFLGQPTEPFAISNIEKKLWSSPDWDEVKFSLGNGETKVVKLRFKFQ